MGGAAQENLLHVRKGVGVLLPLLLLPLLTPVLVVSATVSVSLFEREPVVQWKGIGFLAVFDLIFLTALWLFGEYLLEE